MADPMLLLAAGGKFNPLGHVLDQPVPLTSGAVKFSLVMICLGAVIAFLMLTHAAKRIAIGPDSQGTERWVTKGRLAQLIEAIVVYLRNEMLVPVMGERLTKRYLGFLLSLFFFILVLNLLGLVPLMDLQHVVTRNAAEQEAWVFFGGTATASLAVTGALALISFVVIQIHSIRELGVGGWLEHLCGGPDIVHGPKLLWLVIPVIFVVEFLGLFIKPAALAIRLFANMVGGHTLMATLLGFGGLALGSGLAAPAVGGIAVVSGLFALMIGVLEIFVSFLQAFIFMFLTAVFISVMSHEEHEHEHDDQHAHQHALEASAHH
ncbi:MAG: F0F1 ATP synthase subunit A [Phycisphaerae bacterium]|nr:F0F1 ATP synthase subunit A [Phycisphaerae bacterium]